ncbi:hypothetical protein C7C46_08935 [Streptomyces tateyamensis]|uniref:Phage major capsid protein n=1 Tax=Streptomyces tateyamensis TaxID=565073 RepID=A0A2V4P107_9ACTN|nr:hypothetical protein [Streptomyces tateyamensis]PYC83447.1 hypothetical protein C7C46_08935 [Streptomyces tateyamensis]
MTTTQGPARAPWFDLARHNVRWALPASLQAIMQNGLLDRTFQDSLVPQFLYAATATAEAWAGGLGDTKTFTRTGLMAPVPTAITGNDASTGTYGVEQWSVSMDQYGNAIDTNMLTSSMSLASKWLQDAKTLGVNAGQSINQLVRGRLYTAYAGGRTWATVSSSSSTSLTVQNAAGFGTVLSNGVQIPVSGATPLSITIAGVANTVTGVNTTTNVLTLGTAATVAVGAAVIASTAPVSVRATGANTAYDLTSSNTATFAMFRSAVARLRSMNVPTEGGYYVAHVDATTEAQLFSDADFKQALQGRVDSPIYRDLSIGRFGGIDWVRNMESPTVLGGSAGALTVHRPIVMGADCLVAAPFEGTASLLAGTGVEDVPLIEMIDVAPAVQVARIVRPPQDRLQQVLSTAWSYVGDFGVPSDALSGDNAVFKRAVVLEHA